MSNYYTVWKIARIIMRSDSTVKRWEKKGIIPKAKRDPINGYRCWDERQKQEILVLAQKIN